MLESLFTVLIVGFLAGLIFSIPVAGPINILITSNALSGKLRFCVRTAIGASIIEFFYVLIIVFGIASLYEYYEPFIPYLLILGALVLLIVGIRILKTDLDLKNLDDKSILKDKIRNRGGFRTGILINITNPSLFLGWLTSSFLVFSFVSSIGLNTGGLDLLINKNVSSFKEMATSGLEDIKEIELHEQEQKESREGKNGTTPPILLSLVYATAVAFGSFVWLYYYSRFIVKHRKKLNITLITRVIQILGVVLILISFYLAYKAYEIFF